MEKYYSGYILAVGAGCTFSTSLLGGTILLIVALCLACKCKQTCCTVNK
jgi:hypothetical protein